MNAGPPTPNRIRTCTRDFMVRQHIRLMDRAAADPRAFMLDFASCWLRSTLRPAIVTDAELAETLRVMVDAFDEIDARETHLRYATLAYLRDSGLSSAEYVTSWYADGVWAGDACGCPDPRCEGYHHAAGEECGCLRNAVATVLAAR